MTRKTIHAAGMVLAGVLAGAPAMASGFRHAPVDDVATTAAGIPVSIDVLANDPYITAHSLVRVRQQPAHGSARVEGQQVVYTPAAGFKGRDTLTYSVKSPRRYGIARVTIDVAEGLRLQGRVTDAGAGAAVSAWVGGQRFDAVADDSGGYVLDVAGLDDDMVRLESSSGDVALASIVGSYGRLRSEAGDDGVLTRDENGQVQLSRLSAAQASLLQLALDGAPVAGEAQLGAAMDAMDTDVLLQMAAVVKLVADGDHALPEGVADTMELIGDVDAYAGFVDAVYAADPLALDAAEAATLADAEVVPPSSEASMPGARAILAGAAGGNIRVDLIQGERLVLEAGGRGSFVDASPVAGSGLDWVFEDGVARAIFDTPRVTEALVFRDGRYVRQLRTLEGLDVIRLGAHAASGRELVNVIRHFTTSWPDEPGYPDVSIPVSVSRMARLDGVGEVPFLAAEFPSVRSLPLHRPEAYGPPDLGDAHMGRGQALHRFDAGGSGLVLDDGRAFAWSLGADGGLEVAYDDGRVAQFRRQSIDGRKGEGVLATTVLADGKEVMQYALASVRDGSLEFDLEGLAQPWRSGFDLAQPAFSNTGPLYFVLEADGTGTQWHFAPGIPPSQVPFRWSLDDGVMVIRRYWDRGGIQPECELGVNGCVLFMERRWVPVSRDGDRIYVEEELWLDPDFDGPQPLLLNSQRSNFYEVDAPPVP